MEMNRYADLAISDANSRCHAEEVIACGDSRDSSFDAEEDIYEGVGLDYMSEIMLIAVEG